MISLEGMRMKIYIVEDDESIREMEQYALENSGFKTKGFEDSKSFFTACEEELPGLVILDIMLPGDDGLTILKVLRASPKTTLIPIACPCAAAPV